MNVQPIKNEIHDFIAGQLANTNSPQASELALKFREAIELTQGSVSDGAWWRRETTEAGVAWRGGQ